jgi:hypothetical protein
MLPLAAGVSPRVCGRIVIGCWTLVGGTVLQAVRAKAANARKNHLEQLRFM